ncbi:MAG: Fe-S protein assembly co-chaperone HscB [Halioglobus sp.]
MSYPEFQKNYYQLFDLPVAFALDAAQLGERYRQLQQQLHPDRYAAASEHEQRIAVQYSALVNEAYTTLRQPLPRALYLLKLKGMDQETVSRQKIAGGFLIEQMELREKLEIIGDMVDPETVLDHLMTEIVDDIKMHQKEFEQAYNADDVQEAAAACVKMQYLEKLLREAEQLESTLLD